MPSAHASTQAWLSSVCAQRGVYTWRAGMPTARNAATANVLSSPQRPVAVFSVDVSFISLKHIFPVADAICTPDAVGVCLVKPQFEAGREKVGKKGVVRDPATHREVLKMAEGYAMANHFTPAGLDFSPIKGPEGNIEYLLYVQHCETPQPLPDGLIEKVVAASHETLDKMPNHH